MPDRLRGMQPGLAERIGSGYRPLRKGHSHVKGIMGILDLCRALIARAGLRRKRTRERAFVNDRYYLQANPDVAAAGVDPFDHYMNNGWREGRNPSANFNTLFYRDAYLDGAEVNPLSHFIEQGGPAGDNAPMPPSIEDYTRVQRALVLELFDIAFYRAQVGQTPATDLLTYYLTVGWKDGTSPRPGFDAHRYGAEHPFVKSLGVSPLYHFASQTRFNAKDPRAIVVPVTRMPVLSQQERREMEGVIKPHFDGDYYLGRNLDIKTAGAEPLTHFIDHGWREGRNPTPLFDCRYYLASNPDVAAAQINPYFHYLKQGRAQGLRASPVGTRLYPPMTAPTEADWANAHGAADTAGADYVVIMPVYKGYGETLAAIYAVLTSRQVTRFALHVIDDVSPDARLVTALESLAARKLFSYSRNEANQGFVKSVNRGLRSFADKEVVLLNSDAKVSGDWLDRIHRHAAHDPRIATITPLSNNATICSYPVSNDNNLIEMECSASQLDRYAAECNEGRLTDIPTGVGFCFFMSRASRHAIGILDEVAFGRGYGEENDFCLRAEKAGFRNVLAPDIFVYHAGQVSFAEFAAEEYGPGQKALLAKHPDYPLRVRRHLMADDSVFDRLRLDLFRLARNTGPGAVVFVYHALSGGILTHVKHMEKRLGEEGVPVLHIRVGVGNRWSIELVVEGGDTPFCPNLAPLAFPMLRPHLADFFGWLHPRAIHLHSLVGFDWRATTGVFDLVRTSKIPYFFTVHDYSVVCHRNDLVRTNETYCGLPAIDVCETCVSTDRSYPEGLDPLTRRRTYAAFLNGAAGVFAPSRDIARRLEAAGATYAIIVRPHEEISRPAPIPRAPADSEIIDIVTIGAIGPHKGARVILNLARDAQARALPIRFHIIGYSDMTEEMNAAGVTETGKYKTEADALSHLRAIRPACILLPSIWPETFCYALSLAFKVAVPPVVFDLGAQADRVREAGFGFVVPYAFIDDILGLNDRLGALPYADAALRPTPGVNYPTILRDYYGLAGGSVETEPRGTLAGPKSA